MRADVNGGARRGVDGEDPHLSKGRADAAPGTTRVGALDDAAVGDARVESARRSGVDDQGGGGWMAHDRARPPAQSPVCAHASVDRAPGAGPVRALEYTRAARARIAGGGGRGDGSEGNSIVVVKEARARASPGAA